MTAPFPSRRKWPASLRFSELVAFFARRGAQGRKVRLTMLLFATSGLLTVLLLGALGLETMLPTSLMTLSLYLYFFLGVLLTRLYVEPTSRPAERLTSLRGLEPSPLGSALASATHLLELYLLGLGPALVLSFLYVPRDVAVGSAFWLLLSTLLLTLAVSSLVYIVKRWQVRRPMLFVMLVLVLPAALTPAFFDRSISIPALIWESLGKSLPPGGRG